MRAGKKTRGNTLFYNLDTPDLIGNKYTHPRLEECDAGFVGEAGMERGAVLASHGSGGYYRAPTGSKLRGCAG